MADRQVINCSTGAATTVPQTDAEVAQAAADAAAAAAATAVATTASANALTLTDNLTQQLGSLEGVVSSWAVLTPAQKDAAARGALVACARLTRLLLRRLEAAS